MTIAKFTTISDATKAKVFEKIVPFDLVSNNKLKNTFQGRNTPEGMTIEYNPTLIAALTEEQLIEELSTISNHELGHKYATKSNSILFLSAQHKIDYLTMVSALIDYYDNTEKKNKRQLPAP